VTVVVAARTLKSVEETAVKLKAEGIDASPVKRKSIQHSWIIGPSCRSQRPARKRKDLRL
jgi:hypothetical protein